MLETGIDRGRRRALLSAAALAAGSWRIARAAAYPDRPLRFVVPGGAGGAPDLLCRVMGAALAKGLGQAVVIENRPGAGGIVGISEVARAAPTATRSAMPTWARSRSTSRSTRGCPTTPIGNSRRSR